VISFLGGPAAGESLTVKRAPLFLRVVFSTIRKPGNRWDALDQPTDTPQANETIHVYVRKGKASTIFWKGTKGNSGAFAHAQYAYLEKPPSEDVLRDTEKWQAWCLEHRFHSTILCPKSGC
jgi:hypothetical protein